MPKTTPEYEAIGTTVIRTSLSRTVVFKLIKEGYLTAYRPSPRKTLLKVSEVNAYLESTASAPV